MANTEYTRIARRLAEHQQGRVAREQMLVAGIPSWLITQWVAQGYLQRVLPRVYAVGHSAPSRESSLWAAVLFAGPGAALSHTTAAQWRGLIDHANPRAIEVITPRKVRSIPGIRVYARRDFKRVNHRGLPVVNVLDTLMGLAAVSTPQVVRRALAQLDYRGELDAEAVLNGCRRGRGGSAALRRALELYDPLLAYTNGVLEEEFLTLCRRWRLPDPKLNVWVHGVLVDAYWPEAALVVELDGLANHSSRAQRHRDARNELTLRTHGLTVRRYGWAVLREQARPVRRELEQLIHRAT